MILQKKVKQLQNQDKCKSRQKYLDIINSLKNFFDEQPDTNITDLETEESAPERRNQHWQGIEILTPNEIFSRLLFYLAQLKAGNNSEKLKNEIRQIFYSLYRSKNLQKMSIIIWSTLFKNGSNLYEHWKQ